jgi:hypothetical protein
VTVPLAASAMRANARSSTNEMGKWDNDIAMLTMR